MLASIFLFLAVAVSPLHAQRSKIAAMSLGDFNNSLQDLTGKVSSSVRHTRILFGGKVQYFPPGP
jgi:hypothetical protein